MDVSLATAEIDTLPPEQAERVLRVQLAAAAPARRRTEAARALWPPCRGIG